MLAKLNPDLKEAILRLPEKEKDKLLMRLIRKDLTLVNQLQFQLLEDQGDLEDRRKKTLRNIDAAIERIERIKNYKHFTPRDLLLELRFVSGFVNEHFLITKDKPGEIELRLHILFETFNRVPEFFQYDNYDNEKLLLYFTGRIKNVYTTYNKLHEDLQFDYQEKFNHVLQLAYSCVLQEYLKGIGIPNEV